MFTRDCVYREWRWHFRGRKNWACRHRYWHMFLNLTLLCAHLRFHPSLGYWLHPYHCELIEADDSKAPWTNNE